MNVFNVTGSTKGSDIANQSLAHSIAIGLLQFQGIEAVRTSAKSDLSKQILLLAIQVQNDVAEAVADDSDLNAHALRIDSLELELAQIRAIFKDEATDAWLRDAKAYTASVKLVKDTEGNKMSSLESLKAKASKTLDVYTRTIRDAWMQGLSVETIDTGTDETIPEAMNALKKRIATAKDAKTDFASEVSAACKACDVFAAHVRSTLIGEGTEANEALCKALASLMPLMQIAITEAQKGDQGALGFFSELQETLGATQETEFDITSPMLPDIAGELPEESETDEAIAA